MRYLLFILLCFSVPGLAQQESIRYPGSDTLLTNLVSTKRILNVRSVPFARQPDGDYVHVPADGVAFEDGTLLAADSVFTSNWIDTDGWATIEILINSDVPSAENGIVLEFTNDVQLPVPTIWKQTMYTFSEEDVYNGFIIRAASTLDGFRIVYANGNQTQTQFFIAATLKVNQSESPKQFVESPIDRNTAIPINRTVLTGKDIVNGAYENVSVIPLEHDSIPYRAVLTASVFRPSQLAARSRISVILDQQTVDGQVHTNTPGKVFYVTDIVLNGLNDANNQLGVFYLRDGTSASDPIVMPGLIQEPPVSSTGYATIQMSFNEPLWFNDGVFYDEANGDLTISGVLIGYEE